MRTQRQKLLVLILAVLAAVLAGLLPGSSAVAEDPPLPPGEIVFSTCSGYGIGGSGSTSAIQPDGTGRRGIASSGGFAATSPDGSKVATLEGSVGVGAVIRIREVKTGAVIRTVSAPTAGSFAPLGYVSMAWSPDSTRIVSLGAESATSGTDSGWRLFNIDASVGQITTTIRPVNKVREIAWGPGGWLSLVITATHPFGGVELIPVNGVSGTILSTSFSNYYSPVFRPDGTPAWSGPDSPWSTRAVQPAYPRFSPDPNWWVYAGANNTIWIEKFDGSYRKQIYASGNYICGLGWSGVEPDIAANFTFEEVPGVEPGTYRFTSTTPAVNGFTPSVSWDFGDGPVGQDATTIIHRFTTPGAKLVTLIAKLGPATSRRTKTVDVAAPKLELAIDLVDQATAPTLAVIAAGKTEPQRLLRLTAKGTSGVGMISGVTFGVV